MQRQGSEKAVTFVVSSRSAERFHGDIIPPTTLSNSQGLPSRSKDSRSNSSGTSSATNSTTQAISFQDGPLQEIFQKNLVKRPKRKAPDSSGPPPTVDRALSIKIKKRKVSINDGNIDMPGSQNIVGSQRSSRRIIRYSWYWQRWFRSIRCSIWRSSAM